MKLSRSNTAASIGGAIVTVGTYVTGWDAPPTVIASTILLVTMLLSLVVKDA